MTRLTAAQIEEIRAHADAEVDRMDREAWSSIKRLLGHISLMETENDAFRVGALASSKAISALEEEVAAVNASATKHLARGSDTVARLLLERDDLFDECEKKEAEIARLRKRLEGAAYFDCTPPYIIPRRTISLDELKKQAWYKPPNVAGMFAPNEDPRGGKTHEELKASMSPEVYDKKMEDARQLMRDFRRPGRD